jgi:hypothetical protein
MAMVKTMVNGLTTEFHGGKAFERIRSRAAFKTRFRAVSNDSAPVQTAVEGA